MNNSLIPTETTPENAYHFSDLVDMPAFARMLDRFYNATGIPNGVVDASGELLSMTSGANACAVFHRPHREANAHCHESNLALVRDLRDGCVAGGLCLNGLMDYATPVVIEGRQLATLFLGQILHTPPDMAYFRAQAAQFGFDEKAYLESIAAIPVIDKKTLDDLMGVMVEMAKMLAASGLARLRQTALERDISVHAKRNIQLKDIMDFSPVAMGWSTDEMRIEYVNRQFIEFFGYTLDDLIDLETWYRLAYPDEHYRASVIDPWREKVVQARQNKTSPPELEADITCKDGSVLSVIIRIAWVGHRRMVSFTNITERKRHESRNKAHGAMLEMVARDTDLTNILTAIVRHIESEDKSSRCSIMLADMDGRHLLVGAAPSLPLFFNQAANGIEIGIGVGSCGTAAALGKRVIVEDIQTHEYWRDFRDLAKEAGVHSCWSEPILSSEGKVLGTFAIYHVQPHSPQAEDFERIDFATNLAAIAIENRRVHDELERQAHSDYLTGLNNRRHFLSLAENELDRTLRYDRELSILMFDIDHFKLINDTYGHKIGDVVLKRLAVVCQATLRNIDIIGRIGGEEFAVLLPETGCEQAVEAAERLRATFAATKVTLDGGLPLHFTASFGVVNLDDKEANIDTLLNLADQALYQAKNQGRNRVCLHSDNGEKS